MAGKYLRPRPIDLFFAVIFTLFACTSFCTSSLLALRIPITPHGSSFLMNQLYQYGLNVDPMYLTNPPIYQAISFVDAFVFGPFYLVLVYALLKGANWVRLPALIYVVAILCTNTAFFVFEFSSDHPPLDPGRFLAFNLPYLVVPLAFSYRMRRADPFGASRPRSEHGAQS